MKKILLGNEAIIQAAREAGVGFVSGYPGCPAAEIGDEFAEKFKEYGVYTEISTNEKVALEAAVGASFSGVKSLVNMKSFGINVCSDVLFPLAYTGTKAPMVIVVADDPSCWSSAQSEQDSRGYAYLAHIPFLDPADPQEAYDFTKLGFEISEKFNVPVVLRTTTRVNHQKMPVEIGEVSEYKTKGEFVKDFKRFVTLPPRVMEMKKELLDKIEKIRAFAEKSKVNSISGKGKVGVIVSGVSYLHLREALDYLKINLPVLKLGFFYPLPEKKIANFVKGFKKVLVIEELDNYIEKEVKALASKTEVIGLSGIGELNASKIEEALAKILKLKVKISKPSISPISRRTSRLCDNCPYWHVFPTIKRVAPNAVYGGDIGCYMMAGLSPHNMQDYLFCMGSSIGIAHGIMKAQPFDSAQGKKVISLIGDATFFHSGISGLINAVYNKSNPLMIVLDNRITAMTGHQHNPGMGKTASDEDTEMLKIEDIAKACGVKNIKVLDQANTAEFESAIKEFLDKDEVSVIVCRHMCGLLAKRLQKHV